MKPVAWPRQGFVGPVPVAVTTVRLVREAEVQLRRPFLHLIPLELRSLSPRLITLVSLQGRLPNLHRFRSPVIHDDSWMLRTRCITDWKITVFKCNKSLDHAEPKDFSDAKHSLGSRCFGFVLPMILSQMLWRWVTLKRQKPCTNSEQPPIYGVGGGLFIATRQPDLICPK